MVQQGQTIELTRSGPDGEPLWAYRYRTGGRGSKRGQRGGSPRSRMRVRRSSVSSSGFDGSDELRGGSRSLSSPTPTWPSTTCSPSLPLRGDPHAPAGAPPRRGVGDDRRQPCEGRCRTRSADARSSIRSSHGRNSRQFRGRSGRGTGRWSCSRLRPGYGRRSGSPLRNETSTGRSMSSMCGAPSREASSRSPRQRRACGRCRYSPGT
jgi:hypothetical protein